MDSPHAAQILVYDRVSPLFARAVEALRRLLSPSETPVGRFVHQGDTDRSYGTFASFRAVVFVPGDVEQMAFYEFYTMENPIFMSNDPGRYMWPQLPGWGASEVEVTCGDYKDWAGVWTFDEGLGRATTLAIDCSGRATIAGMDADATLLPLEVMDDRGFTHCLDVDQHEHVHWRLRLFREVLQLLRADVDFPCARSLPGDVVTTTVDGVRTTPEESSLPVLWDHDIFASESWFLDDRLPGPSRTRHSPFHLESRAAFQEWANVIDYFCFPAIGMFSSASELFTMLAGAEGEARLADAAEDMRAYNKRTLQQSTRQWRSVLEAAVRFSAMAV